MRPLVVRLAQFNVAEGGISQSCARAISSIALPTAGPMRLMWVCWPGTPGRLRTERFSWQTNLVFRDEAATDARGLVLPHSLALPAHNGNRFLDISSPERVSPSA